VHCSTGGVHGHVAHPPANEDAPFNPGDVYQDTKLEAEQLARRFGIDLGLDVVVARPIGIHGPGDTRFLKMFKGLAKGRFPMLGPCTAFYHLTYIDDLCEGFRLCGEVPAAKGRTYILAGERYTTLKELVALVAEELGVAPPRLHLPVLAGVDGRAALRAGLRAAQDRAAALPAPGRLLHEEPRLRHHAREGRAGATRPQVDLHTGIQRDRVVPGARDGSSAGTGDRGQGTMRKLNIVHVCDHLGWAGPACTGQAPVRVDDAALRSATSRLARQPAEEGPVGRYTSSSSASTSRTSAGTSSIRPPSRTC
jgi:hypothetical protein